MQYEQFKIQSVCCLYFDGAKTEKLIPCKSAAMCSPLAVGAFLRGARESKRKESKNEQKRNIQQMKRLRLYSVTKQHVDHYVGRA